METNFSLINIFSAIGLTLALFVIFYLFNKISPKALDLLNNSLKESNLSIKFKDLEIIPSSSVAESVLFLAKVLNLGLFLCAFYFYLMLVFGLFPATEKLGNTLFNYVSNFITLISKSTVSFLPNLLSILIIAVITYYLLRFIDLISWALRYKKISFRGFHQEWIKPTHNIVRFFIVVFSMAMIAPYLPGFDSPSFKAMGVFLGVLVTLGSSSAVANVIAGVVLVYMMPFKVGDRVKIGDGIKSKEIIGDVVEMTLLVTRIKTIKNEYVTVPNSMVLGGEMVDYSSPAEKKELILYTSVTIGYEVESQRVIELLLKSAEVLVDILEEPKPFVLIKELENSYVKYELNAYTQSAKNMPLAYSDLHKSILNNFNEAGIEILSADYIAMRDGNKSTIGS